MTFEVMDHYVANNLAQDTAAFLNNYTDNFEDCFGQNGYFNEDTVKAVMSRMLTNWILANDPNETAMVVTELNYPGFNNRADIAVIYLTSDTQPIAPRRLFIELKTDFDADSVDGDIHLLDMIAGVGNSPITEAYAFYTVFNNNIGWTNHIEDPTQGNVYQRAITVAPPPG